LSGVALTATANLNISWGADDNNSGATNNRSVTFDAAQSGLAGLTSNGLEVHFTLLANGTTLVAYTGAVVPTTTTSAGVVFYATLDDTGTGSYNFTLVDNLDHATANTEDNKTLTFAFTATDADGDSIKSSFNVVVNDDAPTFTAPVQSQSVDEEGLASAVLNIAWGVDNTENDALNGATGDRIVIFNAAQPDLAGLTSSGLAVHFTLLANGTTLVAYTGAIVPTTTTSAGVVFYASLNDDNAGSYNFTRVGNIANTGDGALTFAFVAKDSDGDTVTSTFTVNVGQAPIVDLNGVAGSGNNNTVSYPSGVSTLLIAPDATITDDGSTLQSMTITITNPQDNSAAGGSAGANIKELLSLTTEAAALASTNGLVVTFTSDVAHTGDPVTLSITGLASLDIYQQILQGVIYTDTKTGSHNTTDRIVTVVVNDGSLASATQN